MYIGTTLSIIASINSVKIADSEKIRAIKEAIAIKPISVEKEDLYNVIKYLLPFAERQQAKPPTTTQGARNCPNCKKLLMNKENLCSCGQIIDWGNGA